MTNKNLTMDFPKDLEEVKGVVKLGGYYYWNWQFPFRHFKKERIHIITKTRIYLVESGEKE